jgi:Leucine-rich repeat (LRR) protein
MDKFKVDYSQTSPFKGIRILFDYLEAGMEYAQENEIKSVCVWSDGDWSKQTVDFEFLKDKQFIETFHWLVPLSKKSNIDGIYYLSEMTDFRWAVDTNFPLDFLKLNRVERLNLSYIDTTDNINQAKNLRELYLQSVKTKDCTFLSGISQLEVLRIINGYFYSLDGIDGCKKLRELSLIKCKNLYSVSEYLNKLESLESVHIEKCKNILDKELDTLTGIGNLSVIK